MTAQDFLTRILDRKREEVAALERAIPLDLLKEEASRRTGSRDFFGTLSAPARFGGNIIAEIKRGSPSRGIIRGDLDPASQAQCYERGGAAAVSVLTDREFFHGRPEDLKAARDATRLPVLRKDFIISTRQVYESVVMGADAVLLIVRALPPDFLAECLDLCRSLELDALVEVHSESEVETATGAGARLIGINNRDLRTFKTDIGTSVRLGSLLAPGQVAVAESGISERTQIERLLDAGIWNFLIGESLVRAADPESHIRELLRAPSRWSDVS